MKILFSLTVLAISSTVFASGDDLRSRCFVVDRCVQITSPCTADHESNGTDNQTAWFEYRLNKHYACPTNSGVQYIWEQAEITSTGDSILPGDWNEERASAMKECKALVEKFKKDEGVCQ